MDLKTADKRCVRLREIKIERFRGIEALDISFVDPRGRSTSPIVLGGPNGSGKTRALEACMMALGRFDLVRRDKARREDRFPHRLTRRELRPLYEGAQIFAKIERDGKMDEIRLLEEDIVSGLAGHKAVPLHRGPVTYFSSWRGPRLVGAIPIEVESYRRSRIRDEDRLAMIKQFLVNARAHGRMLFDPDDKSGEVVDPQSGTYQIAIGRLNDAWEKFRPGSYEHFSAEPVSAEPGAGFDIFLREVKKTRIPLDVLSSGELEVFTFLGWMVTQSIDLDVVLIDEPELHLDPNWHALALRAFQRLLPTTQFIVTTHSPSLYQSVFEFQRHLLLPSNDPRASVWQSTVSSEDVNSPDSRGTEP